MEIPILKDVVVIFGLSIGVIVLCHRFRIPPIIGFLITGVLAGPHGLGLGQVGEFSFVLAGVGLSAGLIAEGEYQLFLAAAILTMAITPLLIGAAPRIAARLPQRSGWLPSEGGHEAEELEDHLIIVGFGLGGRHLARAARMANIR